MLAAASRDPRLAEKLRQRCHRVINVLAFSFLHADASLHEVLAAGKLIDLQIHSEP